MGATEVKEMKIQVKKVPVTVDNSKRVIKQAPRVKRTPFMTRFVQVCKEDIEDKLAHFKPKPKWDGTVPTIEPRFK